MSLCEFADDVRVCEEEVEQLEDLQPCCGRLQLEIIPELADALYDVLGKSWLKALHLCELPQGLCGCSNASSVIAREEGAKEGGEQFDLISPQRITVEDF